MDKAKIRLSPKEAELVLNADWILTKNGIMEKTKMMLGALQDVQHEYLHSNAVALPGEYVSVPPKISKGENYRGLPYLVLDYPRYFDKNNQLAIRTMFWWGNFFSVTLHLSGDPKKKYGQQLVQFFNQIKEKQFYIGIGEDPWEHHFGEENYVPVDSLDANLFGQYCNSKSYIKLAKKFPLQYWENAGDVLMDTFVTIIHWLEKSVTQPVK